MPTNNHHTVFEFKRKPDYLGTRFLPKPGSKLSSLYYIAYWAEHGEESRSVLLAVPVRARKSSLHRWQRLMNHRTQRQHLQGGIRLNSLLVGAHFPCSNDNPFTFTIAE